LPPISKKDGPRDKGIRTVYFSIIICYKITLLVSEKKKKRAVFGGVLVYAHGYFV